MPSAKIFPDHCFKHSGSREDKLSYRIRLTLREPGQYSYKQVRALKRLSVSRAGRGPLVEVIAVLMLLQAFKVE